MITIATVYCDEIEFVKERKRSTHEQSSTEIVKKRKQSGYIEEGLAFEGCYYKCFE